jgi:hypothetical protein
MMQAVKGDPHNKTRPTTKQTCEMAPPPRREPEEKRNQAGISTTYVFQPQFEE